MEGFYFISYETLGGEGIDFDWLWDNEGTENVVEVDDGYWVKNFPDSIPDGGNGIPDFLETGPGSGTTTSQGWIGG